MRPKNFPTYKKGKLPCSGKAIIDLDRIDAEIKDCEEHIKEFEKRAGHKAEAEESRRKYTGVTFVIFENPTDIYEVTQK